MAKYHKYNGHFIFLFFINSLKAYVSLKIIKTKIIIINLTSYENVWSTTRTDPIIEYIELEDHPINKNIYPIKVKILTIINKDYFIN